MLWLISLLAATIRFVAATPVDVSVEAPWRPCSEALITLETLAGYNNSAYFPLLSALLSERMKEDVDNDAKALFSIAEKTQFLKQSAVGLAKQEIALGTVLPIIENKYELFESLDGGRAFQTYQESLKKNIECPVVFWSEGEYSCDRTDLYALQAPETPKTPELFSNDRVIGSGPLWIVVYADLDSVDFPDWHSVLLEMALSEKITYVLRYKPSASSLNSSSPENVKLAGYGVGFHVKRTDYLVIDDRGQEDEVKIDLDAPHQVPASKVPYLGFSAAREIRNQKTGQEQFELLRNISYNFPDHASRLAQSAAGPEAFDSERAENKIGALGLNGVLINGGLFQGRDVFEFYSALHRELDLAHTLEMNLPDDADVSRLLSSGIAMDDYDDASGEVTRPRQRYDLRKSDSAIGWINDIENDLVFQSLEDDLDILHTSEGPFVPLKRNIHTMVLAGSLTDPRMLMTLKSLLQQVGQQLPLQIGIVSDTPEWLRVAKLGLEARQTFLIQIILGGTAKDAEQNAKETYEKVGNPVKKSLTDPHEWMKRFGVEEQASKGPVLFVNGIPLTLETWRESSILIFENDFKYLQSLDSIKPDTSLRDLIFATGLPERNQLMDPMDDIVFTPWPLTSPLQPFKNPEMDKVKSNKKHSVLLSSSFKSPAAFELADAVLKRSVESMDVELTVRPLSGIDEKLYAAMFDPMYNTFRFSRDLFSAVKAHFFEKKTAPKVLNAARKPEVPLAYLPVDTDSLIIDGRYIELEGEKLSADLLNSLIDRETSRLERIQKRVPGISGLGVAALTAAAQGRTMITDSDQPDISLRNDATLKITAIIDPATTEGQTLIALSTVAVAGNLSVDVYLSPSELSEMPSRHYTAVFDREEGATFTNLADDVLYTAELIEPPAWATTASKCDYDLDNVVLSTVKEDRLESIYTLQGLLVQGFAVGKSAPGVPLSLRFVNGTKIADTAVMANLGYFQLAAPRPGPYEICVTDPKFSVNSALGPIDCVAISVVRQSGASAKLEILETPPKIFVGTERQDSHHEKSMWGKLKSFVENRDSSHDAPATTSEINIFTIASGHLYERFASIMMLSVMRHTKHSVKFWLIENFMSPKFKKFVPELAKEHGFDYEFVSYKWPTWLRGQSEKQRQIWGYKILFLDVIFPQSLSNIIFVDSDQIVRTDFKELLDIDLKKAPYAFTPMCDDREEMEPYRFWKQGYWKKALIDEGYKYHISALYRVDLDKFRKLKAGDVLRQQYQRLSANPENLSNLDQDLPNSLQPVIPIHSLPQTWLWCETWCHDAGLSWAKTIDLCNNPLTKEPKLDRARRQIPEWVEYDEIVSKFAETLADRWESQSAAGTDDSKPTAGYEYEHPNEHDFSEDEGDVMHDEL